MSKCLTILTLPPVVSDTLAEQLSQEDLAQAPDLLDIRGQPVKVTNDIHCPNWRDYGFDCLLEHRFHLLLMTYRNQRVRHIRVKPVLITQRRDDYINPKTGRYGKGKMAQIQCDVQDAYDLSPKNYQTIQIKAFLDQLAKIKCIVSLKETADALNTPIEAVKKFAQHAGYGYFIYAGISYLILSGYSVNEFMKCGARTSWHPKSLNAGQLLSDMLSGQAINAPSRIYQVRHYRGAARERARMAQEARCVRVRTELDQRISAAAGQAVRREPPARP